MSGQASSWTRPCTPFRSAAKKAGQSRFRRLRRPGPARRPRQGKRPCPGPRRPARAWSRGRDPWAGPYSTRASIPVPRRRTQGLPARANGRRSAASRPARGPGRDLPSARCRRQRRRPEPGTTAGIRQVPGRPVRRRYHVRRHHHERPCQSSRHVTRPDRPPAPSQRATARGGKVCGASAGSSSQRPDARSAAPHGCPAKARVQTMDVTGATRPPDPGS